jgi:hypothetical protein
MFVEEGRDRSFKFLDAAMNTTTDLLVGEHGKETPPDSARNYWSGSGARVPAPPPPFLIGQRSFTRRLVLAVPHRHPFCPCRLVLGRGGLSAFSGLGDAHARRAATSARYSASVPASMLRASGMVGS